MTPAEIWKGLTPSQRVTLLDDAGVRVEHVPAEIAIAAGIQHRGHITYANPSGTARHALGRRGLLLIGQTVPMPTSAAGFHTPRELTPLGRQVVDYALTLLRAPDHAAKKVVMPKKKTQQSSTKKVPSPPNPIEAIRRVMRSTGFDEEEVYGGAPDQLHFASREEGDVLEGRADPGTVRFAREKAKEIEVAVPGAKARVEIVDEWVSIAVTLAGRNPEPRDPPLDLRVIPQPPSGYEVGNTPRQRATLRPGDEVKYTNFTIGGSHEGTAIVTWDHGKSVEARTLDGEKLRLERAADGSLRRFT